MAKVVLEGTDCPHCERLLLHMLRSRKALFEECVFVSVPNGAGPEAEQRLHSWGSQIDLVKGMETGESLSCSGRSGQAKYGSRT